MVGAMARRPVPMAVPAVLAREQSVEGVEEIVVRSGADLEHHDTGRGMRDEDGQQAVLGLDVGQECDARRGQVGDPASGSCPDREQASVYGKMLRSASRRRPRPPIAGADS